MLNSIRIESDENKVGNYIRNDDSDLSFGLLISINNMTSIFLPFPFSQSFNLLNSIDH